MTRTDATRSFFFYDLETSGIDPRWHRVMQFAGLRTDLELNETGEALSTYIRLPVDVLPDPGSCQVTGLTPQRVNQEGLEEFDAFRRIDALLGQRGTCTVGFNSLRFDDEFLRYGFYRNLFDPYAREYRDGNSRWDVIDLLRATAALRPEGIHWPQQDGLPSFRLQLFSAANGLQHDQAHDAMSDVRATIAAARLIREFQPRLFDYYLTLRSKTEVLKVIRPGRNQPCVHVSGRLSRERNCLSVMLPIVVHGSNRNSIIAIDLCRDFEAFQDLTVEELQERLFTPGDHERPGIKEIRVNRCPFVAPLSVLRQEDQARLGIDLEAALGRARRLAEQGDLAIKLRAVFDRPFEHPSADVDAELYSGFFSDADRDRCVVARQCLGTGQLPTVAFDDPRLTELMFRLCARSRSGMGLDAEERDAWRAQVARKLADPPGGLGFASYRAALDELAQTAGTEGLISELGAHADQVELFLEGSNGILEDPAEHTRTPGDG